MEQHQHWIDGAHRPASTWALNFAVPFGGRKLSGDGRENGIDGLREFTQAKGIWFETDSAPVGDPFVLR